MLNSVHNAQTSAHKTYTNLLTRLAQNRHIRLATIDRGQFNMKKQMGKCHIHIWIHDDTVRLIVDDYIYIYIYVWMHRYTYRYMYGLRDNMGGSEAATRPRSSQGSLGTSRDPHDDDDADYHNMIT